MSNCQLHYYLHTYFCIQKLKINKYNRKQTQFIRRQVYEKKCFASIGTNSKLMQTKKNKTNAHGINIFLYNHKKDGHVSAIK